MYNTINKSLASRIVFFVLIFCILLFVISLSAFYFSSKRQIEQITIEYATTLAENTDLQIEQILIPLTKVAQNYLWLIEENNFDSDSLFGLTAEVLRNNPEALGCAIAFKPWFFEGHGEFFSPYSYREGDSIYTMQLGNKEYDYFYMDWFQIPFTTKEPYWTEPYHDTGGADVLMTTYSVPFYKSVNGERILAGVFTVDLGLDFLTEIVSGVSIMETGYASLISRHGTFITHPNHDLIMNQTIFSYAAEIGNQNLRNIGRDMQAGHTDFVESELHGIDRYIFYTPLETSGWSLAVVFPKKEMFAPLRKISIMLIALVIAGLVLLSLVVTRIVKSQINPLKFFARSAHHIANGNFDTPLPEIKTQDEMKELHESFETMQSDLKKYIKNLKDATSAKEKIESELRIAREIQMGMIPKIFPPFPNISEIDLFAMLEPAKEVGGDLYDFFLVDDKHLCFAIGDVSGKGVPASLFMAVTRTLLRSIAPNQLSTKDIAKVLNSSLAIGNESSMFVTFFLGIINLETGEMCYTNAGHNPPVIMKKNRKVEFFEITNDIPLGLFDDFEFTEKKITLDLNDKLFLYTDGITEAENWNEELYSDQRLLDCLSEIESTDPSEIIMKVARDVVVHVNDYQQSDDLTMMSIIYFGKQK